MSEIKFDGIVFKEGNTYVSYTPKLDISSCGNTRGVDGAQLFLMNGDIRVLSQLLKLCSAQSRSFGSNIKPHAILYKTQSCF